ncbi:MAG: hypothetical protein WDO71_09285 [Bacteroidota bacterium]
MSKVSKAEELEAAIAKAFNEDDQVLVEEMIQGREFTVGVFKTKGNIIVLPLTEVKAHDDKDFFYMWGGRTIFGVDCSGFVQVNYK